VELQIGGAAAPELVWRSWSPPKHALSGVARGEGLVGAMAPPIVCKFVLKRSDFDKLFRLISTIDLLKNEKTNPRYAIVCIINCRGTTLTDI
jgi:hypothetical protein